MDLIFQAIIIGLVQGLTEFIPVSSSAHLELVPWILGWPQDGLIGSLSFDVFLHLGTLLALLVYVGRDWLRLLGACGAVLERRIGDDPDRRLGWLLVLATIPAALIGFAFEDAIERVPRRRRHVPAGDRRLPGDRRGRPVPRGPVGGGTRLDHVAAAGR